MFQSYKFIKHLKDKYGKYSFEYDLTDSDFGTVSEVGVAPAVGVASGLVIAVIQEYSKRNLNVAKNLMLAFIWHNKKYPSMSIQELVDLNKKNPLFSQYEEDLQKYLPLL